MPGLVGMVSTEGVDENLLNKMIDSLKHEDFYQTDKYVGPSFALARLHLGIFNPYPQPIFNEDNSICIFLDGKVYDYNKQLEELKKLGHKFDNENDCELCLHSYEEYGLDFIKQLNGTFVLLIHHLDSGKTIIANDRCGLRVHYFYENDKRLFVTPEPKAILQDYSFKKELNNDAVSEFFAFGQFWNDKTLFKGIKALTPASILTYEKGKLSKEKYWEFKYEPDNKKSEDELASELVRTFRKAVKIRTEEEHHFGIALSGGLDSRSVLAAIPKSRIKDVTAYTFGPPDCLEVKVGKKVAQATDIEHLLFDITPELIMDNAEEEIWLTDGRNYIGVSFAYPINKMIRGKVDVIFDGYALDMTLGGSFLNKDIVECKDVHSLTNILSGKRLFNDEELRSFFTKEFYDRVKDFPKKSFEVEFNKTKAENLANKSDQFGFNTHVAWFPIGYVFSRDLMEISHPTSDNDFLDVILKIPPEWRLNHHIYRKFLKKLSPTLANLPYDKTMIRPTAPHFLWKMGDLYLGSQEFLKKKLFAFSNGRIAIQNRRSYVNYEEWFRIDKKWQGFFEKIFLHEKEVYEKYLNHKYIEKLYNEMKTGQKDNSTKLLYIASFIIFLRLYGFGKHI